MQQQFLSFLATNKYKDLQVINYFNNFLSIFFDILKIEFR